MVTLEQWESGAKIPDDFYEPMYQREPSALDRVVPNRLVCFCGRDTGVCIDSGFADVLEFSTTGSEKEAAE